MSRKKKIVDIVDSYPEIEVPYDVWRFFGRQCKFVSFAGDQASFGEDYGAKEELRQCLDWYVDQLGGKVKWK